MRFINANNQTYYLTQHAHDRATEMGVHPDTITEILADPDETRTATHWSKYAGDTTYYRAHLAIPTTQGPRDTHPAILTILPRTKDEWARLDALGLLGDDRHVRDNSHLPTKADLQAAGLYRELTTTHRTELAEALTHAQRSLRADPNNPRLRHHYDQLRHMYARSAS